jgi:hypothetical protein
MSTVNVELDMYLPPTTLCKGYQVQKTASAAAAQLASLATDGRSVTGSNATCADVPVAVSGGRRLQAITQPKITIAIFFDTPAEGSMATSYQDLAGWIKSILLEQATAVSQARQ